MFETIDWARVISSTELRGDKAILVELPVLVYKKAYLQKRFLLRFTARFSPFEGCEKVVTNVPGCVIL